jgi:hypothetical protein
MFSVVTKLWAARSRLWFSNWSKRFLSSPKCPHLLWGSPSHLFKGYQGLSTPREKAATAESSLITFIRDFRLRVTGAILPVPVHAFTVWTWKNLALYIIYYLVSHAGKLLNVLFGGLFSEWSNSCAHLNKAMDLLCFTDQLLQLFWSMTHYWTMHILYDVCLCIYISLSPEGLHIFCYLAHTERN